MQEEYRIPITGEAKRAYIENFKAIEGMEERKKQVLAEIRERKEGRK